MRVHIFKTFALLGMTACGVVTPKACEIEDHHFSKDAPVKIGEGMISYYNYPLAYSSGSYVYIDRTVIDCATNEELTIVYIADDTPGTSDGVYSGEAGKTFEQNFKGKSFANLAEVRAVAESGGLTVNSRILDDEDCGCAAFYPELRGDKSPYTL